MDCENSWPLQRACSPRGCRIATKITGRKWIPAQTHWILWLLYIGLQIADVVTTNYSLAVPGNWEVNPIMRLFQSHLGAVWWLPKIVAVGFSAVVLPQTLRPWPILFAVWYYVVVVSSNLAFL